MAQKNVLFVGETWIVTKFHTKGFDVVPLGGYDDFSVYFKKGMEPFKDVNIDHIPNHLVLSAYPQTMEHISKYDVVIISDCGRNTLTMYPDMFTVPMGPDKVQLTADYVKNGGSLVMVGGYVDFQGFQGKGNYHGSAIEDVLPVNIMDRDDRVEGTQGVKPEVVEPDHEILADISPDWPDFLGYQKVHPKEHARVLAKIGKDNDPFIIIGESGKGRSMAFMSDLSPHWGTDFVNWKDYGKFWYNSIKWLSDK